jgi:hypothetical protein
LTRSSQNVIPNDWAVDRLIVRAIAVLIGSQVVSYDIVKLSGVCLGIRKAEYFWTASDPIDNSLLSDCKFNIPSWSIFIDVR